MWVKRGLRRTMCPWLLRNSSEDRTVFPAHPGHATALTAMAMPATCHWKEPGKYAEVFRKTQHLNPHYSKGKDGIFFFPKLEEETMKSSGCLRGLLLLGGRTDLSALPISVLFHRKLLLFFRPQHLPQPSFALPLSAGATCTYCPASSFEQLQMQSFEGKKKLVLSSWTSL